MNRMHLLELEDQKWCPTIIRECITDFLSTLDDLLGIFHPAYEKIAELIKITGIDSIVDCCSGSAGPMLNLRKHLDAMGLSSTTITLTDKYPNKALFAYFEAKYGNRLKGIPDSLDALNLPTSLKGIRCFFSSFHHFKPNQARAILQKAAADKTPIAIFECTQRHILDITRAFISPLLMLIMMPFSGRLTWKKFVFTYLIPIAPLAFMWDYQVSNLRTYSTKEMLRLIADLQTPDYHFETGHLWSQPAKSYVPYLIGQCSR